MTSHYRTLSRQLVPGSLVALTLTILSSTAQADLYANYCFGTPDELDTGGLFEARNAPTMPVGSGQQMAFVNAIGEWNLVSAMPVYETGAQNDDSFQHGDWVNEFGLVNRSDIDNDNGKTVYRHVNFCAEPGHHGDYSEADSMIAVDLNFQNMLEEQFVTKSGVGGGRGTILHEMGHQLGLGHFGSFNYLNTIDRRPAAAAGGTKFAPFPSDMAPLVRLYGWKGNTNIFNSAQFQSGLDVDNNLPAGQIFFCPNSPLTIKMTVANVGASNITFNQRVRMVRRDGLVIELVNWPGGTVGWHNHFTWNVAVSLAGVPAGEYTVFHHIDFDNRISEWQEDDNFVIQSRNFVMFPPQWC